MEAERQAELEAAAGLIGEGQDQTGTGEGGQTGEGQTGQTGADFLNDPDAAPPQEADNTDLAVPLQDTERITGGEQLGDDGIANDDTDLIN